MLAPGYLSTSSNFYPRPPRGGRRGFLLCQKPEETFLSTPSARRATLPKIAQSYRRGISIHALREEGDRAAPAGSWPAIAFLSTPSARRATFANSAKYQITLFLSTPSARRATVIRAPLPPKLVISIHALREEGDFGEILFFAERFEFLSTPSARRATHQSIAVARPHDISIHALREEGDLQAAAGTAMPPHFYPRPPRGGRQEGRGLDRRICYFYPRPPRGGRPS